MKFLKGKTYQTRFINDHNSTLDVHVEARTEKTITANFDGDVKRLRVTQIDGIEVVYPLGKYSMAPILRANRSIAAY